MRFGLSVDPMLPSRHHRALGDRSLSTDLLTVLQKMPFPICASQCHLPRLRPGSHSAFDVFFLSFVHVSSDTRRQTSHVSGGAKLGFIGHAYQQNECLRGGRDKWQEEESHISGIPCRLREAHVTSLCANQGCLTRDVSFCKQHPT